MQFITFQLSTNGVKRTWVGALHVSAYDPKRTLNVRFCCDAQRGGRRRQIATAAIRSIGAVFSLTRAVKGHMNSPWTVRTTPAVSVHVRVAFRRGRGICGCIELICYQITKAPAGSGGGLVLSGLRPLRHNEGGQHADCADCDPPASPGRARGLGAAVEGLSRFLPDHGAAGDLRRDLGAAARSERADVAARRLRRRQASRHRALHLSPLLLDHRRLLLSAGSVRGRGRAQARAGPRADRGGIRGRARGRREPRPLAHARDQRRCAQPLRHAGGPPRLHPVSQALLTIRGSIEIRAKWRGEWVVSVERRFTHGGILAALIDLAADWALVRQTGRGVPTIDMRVDYPKAPRPAICRSSFPPKLNV